MAKLSKVRTGLPTRGYRWELLVMIFLTYLTLLRVSSCDKITTEEIQLGLKANQEPLTAAAASPAENGTIAASPVNEDAMENKTVKYEKIHVQRGWDKSLETDEKLFPKVDTRVEMRQGFEETLFDKLVLNLTSQGYLVLHQTWRTTCVLNNKVLPMKSWSLVEKDRLRVIFWTDKAMDVWMDTHFLDTRVYEAWKWLCRARERHIKRADFFRVLLVWFYGSIYADLDIQIKQSFRPLLEQRLTTMIWEPTQSMKELTGYKDGDDWYTQMLSGFVSSGVRYSDFLGFYINWTIENHLSGRKDRRIDVLDSTGPRAEAEAYKYYISRLDRYDRLLRVMSFDEFKAMYGDHLTESTWNPGAWKGDCTNVQEIYERESVYLAPEHQDDGEEEVEEESEN